MKILRYLIVISFILSLSLFVHADHATPSCNTLEEFYEHQATYDNLPQPFVGYNTLQTFGEFQRYHYDFGAYKNASYFLLDANGHEIIISIGYPGNFGFSNGKRLPMDKSMTDMRTLPSGGSGIVRHNKIDYRYSNGILSSISWKIADVEITLAMDRDAGAYPLDAEPTPISRLLSTDKETAYSVVEELADAIDPDGSYRAAYTAKLWVKIIAPILIIPAPIIVTLIVLHLRAKKRRCHAS